MAAVGGLSGTWLNPVWAGATFAAPDPAAAGLADCPAAAAGLPAEPVPPVLGEPGLDVPVDGPDERPLELGLPPLTAEEGAEPPPPLLTGDADAAGAGAEGDSAAGGAGISPARGRVMGPLGK
ncbi:hypothetical protein ACVWWN_000563 [Mycobacterium sp. URHB0021]